MSAKDPSFIEQLLCWERLGLVAEWRDAKPHVIATRGQWTPLATKQSTERWFVGVPTMRSILQLSPVERELITFVQGDVFDFNTEGGQCIVAMQQPVPPEAAADLEADVPIAAYKYSHAIVAVPVEEVRLMQMSQSCLPNLVGGARVVEARIAFHR